MSSEFNIESNPAEKSGVMYIRWMRDPNALSEFYMQRCRMFIGVSAAIFGVLAYCKMSFIVSMVSKDAANV